MDSSQHFRVRCSISFKASSNKKGTTSVNPTAASFENPVTFFPLTKILRFYFFFNTAGE
jgi:hypothetical protein